MKKFLLINLIICSSLFCGCNSKKEYKSYHMGNLEVMQSDLGVMSWNEAINSCNKIGDGWRLPTYEEFELICKNKANISGLDVHHLYWCKDEKDLSEAWAQDLNICSVMPYNKNNNAFVRPVRKQN